MIADRPSHGYELIKAVEERSGGSYVPSPGVAYPTLAWLDDMGYAVIEPEEKGRKLYRITPDGQAFLTENRELADILLSRLSPSARGHVPPPVLRAMENVKFALRLRLKQETVDATTIEAIAVALDAAAKAIERS
ncbi:PadR family transcriptional regulator [Rhizobium sp. PP-F2F-G48]|uniref:PadR family transcriptional regulator n=1 Tax=Rhizobium sp. PP-F2F-G48 TaxID=2135651 RepID=UPI0010D53F24|nr:PadR family transcriptional regulator [Rhizobium sp. PP-F2F-G48]TCM53213.1 PadR family transcriptional regulator [Rhizobium sp. PP-F2F-G48]